MTHGKVKVPSFPFSRDTHFCHSTLSLSTPCTGASATPTSSEQLHTHRNPHCNLSMATQAHGTRDSLEPNVEAPVNPCGHTHLPKLWLPCQGGGCVQLRVTAPCVPSWTPCLWGSWGCTSLLPTVQKSAAEVRLSNNAGLVLCLKMTS